MSIDLDKEGYLQDLNQWSEEIAIYIANNEGIELTPAHWELIFLIRQFYKSYQLSPAMRPLIKTIKEKLGEEKATSIHLLRLFPDSPAKRLAKIAGLPRPDNCL